MNFMLEAVFDNALVFDPSGANFVLKNCMDLDNPSICSAQEMLVT